MACVPSKDSDRIGLGIPSSLIRVFAVRMKKAWVLSYSLSAQWRLWSDWADAQVDLSLRWAHMPFCWFCRDTAHFLFSDCLQGCVSSLLDLLLDGMVPELPTSTNTQLPCLARTSSLIQLSQLNTLVRNVCAEHDENQQNDCAPS